MDTKATTYLAIIFASFIIGFLVPINMALGAPLSLVALAYFQPYLKIKITICCFLLLTIANVALSFSAIVGLFTVANNIYQMIGIPYYCTTIVVIGGIIFARVMIMKSANAVIKKSKIRNRYPLPP